MPSISQIYDSAGDAAASSKWIETIHRVFGEVDVKIEDSDRFAGKIRSAQLGHVTINKVECSSEDASRNRRQVASDETGYFALSFVTRGQLHLEQQGRVCEAGPGRFVLFDLNAPYRHQHTSWTDVLSIKIPSVMLHGRLSGAHQYVARTGQADRGIGLVTRDALATLAEESDCVAEHAAQACSAKMIDLIAILLESGLDDMPLQDSSVRTALRRRITGFIEAHLSDPRLDARTIAASNGISVRYLHKIFQDSGESVGAFLRMSRLERCYEDLSRADPRHVPIKEIAFRAGYASQAHFATDFKRKYQMSPTEFRRSSHA